MMLALAGLAAFAADDASMSGKWQVHTSIAGNQSEQSCTFTQKGSELKGSCTTQDRGTVEITGKVSGKKVTWMYKSEHDGTPLTVNYEATVDSADKIAGSVSVPEFSVDGDFTATRGTL